MEINKTELKNNLKNQWRDKSAKSLARQLKTKNKKTTATKREDRNCQYQDRKKE